MSAATVSAVAGVASAAVGAASALSAGGGGSDIYGSKVEAVPYENKVGTEDSYARVFPNEVNDNLDIALPEIYKIQQEINVRQQKYRDYYTSGNFSETEKQEGANILAMEKGQIPGDVAESIQRIVAENLGGSFDPNGVGGGGFGNSRPQNALARSLGLTSLDLMRQGMSYGPSWRSNVNSFIYSPLDIASGLYFPMTQAVLQASELQKGIDENEYVSANNIAKANAMPDPAAVGGMNDSLAAGAGLSQGISNFGSAVAGLGSIFKPTASAGSVQPTIYQGQVASPY